MGEELEHRGDAMRERGDVGRVAEVPVVDPRGLDGTAGAGRDERDGEDALPRMGRRGVRLDPGEDWRSYGPSHPGDASFRIACSSGSHRRRAKSARRAASSALPSNSSWMVGWSCRPRPTPGRSWRTAVPARSSVPRSPIPDRSSSSGVPYAPPHSTVSAAWISIGPAGARASMRVGPAGLRRDALHLGPVEDPQAIADRIEVREGGVPAHAVGDVHRRAAGAGAAVEVVEVVRQAVARGRARLEERRLERLDLVGRVVAEPHRGARAIEGGREIGRRPAGRAPPPRVVVAPPAPVLRAAVVGGAAAEHPGPVEREHPAPRARGAVAPVMARRQRAAVQQVGGPAARAGRAVVGACLDHEHVAPRCRQPRGEHRAGRPAADDRDLGFRPGGHGRMLRRAHRQHALAGRDHRALDQLRQQHRGGELDRQQGEQDDELRGGGVRRRGAAEDEPDERSGQRDQPDAARLVDERGSAPCAALAGPPGRAPSRASSPRQSRASISPRRRQRRQELTAGSATWRPSRRR